VPTNQQENSWQSTLQDFGRTLDQITFVVVDLETTGGAPHLGAAITEIGAIKSRGGKILGEYQTFVDPGHPVPAYITELTGITDQMLFQSPRISALMPQFLEFLGSESETVLVAQNAPFDLSFLTHAAKEASFAWPAYPVLDTAIIARKVLTRDEVPNCRLSTLANFFGTQTTPNHRALDDARATLDVFHGLLERLGSFDIYTLEELMNFGKRTKKPKSPATKQSID
jgi:DNA polymerase III epsilon subunit family exonuclease